MDLITLAILLIALLFAVLALGLWVGFGLAAVGLVAMLLASPAPAGPVLASSLWSALNSWELTALPMFIWMGEILYRTRLAKDMFDGLAPWLARLPGRLLHVNVLGCAIFAAVSGSSAATCATIGRIALPELKKRGYDEHMAIGTLAGSGTLGLLIPPSIIMIVYAAATDQSVARLFIAGLLPGIMLATLFSGYVAAWALINRRRMPPPEPAMPLSAKLRATWRLLPVVLLIAGVIGVIYIGLASATEAAAIGVLFSLVLARLTGALTIASFKEGLLAATRTSCMICFILAGAAFLTTAMGFTGLPRALAIAVGELGLPPWGLLVALTVFFVMLGCFLDGISMVVLTTAVIMPMVETAGFDLIWFGIYIVLVVEMAQITPPVGFNLYVLQALTGRHIFAIGRDAFPLFVLMCAAVALIAAFPEIALWLPRTMFEG